MIENVAIPFPVSENGTLDLAKQQKTADVYISIRQTKKSLCELRAQLSGVSVVLDNDEYSTEYLPLPMLFEMSKGFAKYTKKYGNLHSGQYPVYSASSQKPLIHLDTYDYDGRYMTWAKNGFAGTLLILNGRFSINGDRGILLPKDDRTDLDFDYMKFILEPIFREMAKGRRGDNGEGEFTKLYPSILEDVMIPVPVDHSSGSGKQCTGIFRCRLLGADGRQVPSASAQLRSMHKQLLASAVYTGRGGLAAKPPPPLEGARWPQAIPPPADGGGE